MKLLKAISIFLFLTMYSTSYAQQSNDIFVGQDRNHDSLETALFLEQLKSDPEKYIEINRDGRIYLKVGALVSLAENFLPDFVAADMHTPLSPPVLATNHSMTESYEDKEIRCRNPHCRYYYTPRPGHRKCPRCGTEN